MLNYDIIVSFGYVRNHDSEYYDCNQRPINLLAHHWLQRGGRGVHNHNSDHYVSVLLFHPEYCCCWCNPHKQTPLD